MKTKLFSAAVVAALLSVQAVAQEKKPKPQPPAAAKDWCLLDSSRCDRSGYPLLEKIERLKRAIAQGTAVYTPEELKVLQARLQEAEGFDQLLNQ